MGFNVKFSDKTRKQLSKFNNYTRRMLIAWIEKNLQGIRDPHIIGKALKGNPDGYWRYRVGDYRIITQIIDNEVIILIISIGHRKEIHK